MKNDRTHSRFTAKSPIRLLVLAIFVIGGLGLTARLGLASGGGVQAPPKATSRASLWSQNGWKPLFLSFTDSRRTPKPHPRRTTTQQPTATNNPTSIVPVTTATKNPTATRPPATATQIPTTVVQPTSTPITPTSTTPPGSTCTNCYYFDSVRGSDSNHGRSPDSAWQSLSKMNATVFKAGETVYFMRGSTWTGGLVLDNSGAQGNPIRFTVYGDESAPPPVFRNPGSSSSMTTAIKITGDWNVLEGVKVVEARLAGVYIETGADYNVVQNIEATQVGEGVNVHGQNNKVLNNYIHDLTMVVNTSGGDDDYGAVGVWLFNHNNEVAYNRIINCKAPSYDYTYDGGAVEMFRDVNNAFIHHNYANNTQGFTEIGGGTAYDNVIAYNVMVNVGRPLGMHLGGGFASVVRNLRFEHNTVVDTTADGFWAGILFLNGSATPDMLLMRNNIFYLKNFDRVANASNFTHQNNLYYIPNGTLGFSLHSSEIQADPQFINLNGGDYHLQAGSPAIDRGANLGYTVDFDNRAVPAGSAPDPGAYER